MSIHSIHLPHHTTPAQAMHRVHDASVRFDDQLMRTARRPLIIAGAATGAVATVLAVAGVGVLL